MDDTVIEQSHVLDLVSDSLLFFGIAGLVVPLLQRLKVSPVLAYLLCGIAIGPHGFAALPGAREWLAPLTIEDKSTVEMLGELGIITLMFMIGLELSLERLRELKHYIFGLGSAQILVTAVVIFALARMFDNSPKAAVLIGASLALSSTAIVMKLLEDQRLANRPIGTLSFAILLMQDLAVVPILIVLASFAGAEQSGLGEIFKILGIGAATVLAIFVLGRRIVKLLLGAVSTPRNAEWLTAFTGFFVVACAATTHAVGLSLALGAFLAGLLISETEFRHEVETIVGPLKGLLLGIFFLSVGMTIDVRGVASAPLLLAASVAGIYLVKAAILFPLCIAFKVPPARAAEAAVYLAQPGEFALLVLGAAMATHVIPVESAQFFLLMTTLAMMITPLLFKCAPLAVSLASRFQKSSTQDPEFPDADEHVVIIAGFGRVGQLLGNALDELKIPYVAFDNDVERVQLLRARGFRVVFGDARKLDLWQRLRGGHADVIAAVIAIDDHAATHGVLKSIRGEWPLLSIIVRAKDTHEMERLYDIGADYVVVETLESSLRMARLVMENIGTEPTAIEKIIKNLWERNALSGNQE